MTNCDIKIARHLTALQFVNRNYPKMQFTNLKCATDKSHICNLEIKNLQIFINRKCVSYKFYNL